uniref:ANK_REP_REGION domain-containing protein n=1 Tax=Macrostomum lignano TaxID=282301 RepID=A0A1I8H0U2_9PLAT
MVNRDASMGNSIGSEKISTPELADELYQAARLGRLSDLRALLHRRPSVDPNGRTSAGRTPLIGAALADAWEAAQMLLEAGARPDEPDSAKLGGCTPLMVAAQRDAQAVAGVLLHAGADADATTQPDGQTALMWCCQADLPRMAGLLISRGARVDRRRQLDAATPLMLAARNNSARVAELLLELGAAPDLRGPAGFTALMVTALVDAVDVAARLLSFGADRLVADSAGRTALHVCARHGSLRVARLLLGSGVDPNPAPTSPQDGGHTPVTLAAAHGHLDCLRLLIRRGADYLHRCADGRDIRAIAEASGCARTAELARSLIEESQSQRSHSNQTETDFKWLHTHEDGLRPELKPTLAALLKTVSEEEDEVEEGGGGQRAKRRSKISGDASVRPVPPLDAATKDFKATTPAAPSVKTRNVGNNRRSSDASLTEGSSVATASDRSDSPPEEDRLIEQLIIRKRIVTKETSGQRVVSVKEEQLELVVDCGEISETVHVKSGAPAIAAAAAARGADAFRSTGSQFYS